MPDLGMRQRCDGDRCMLMPLKLVRDQQLQQQIFEQLRELIVSHRLQPGLRMPSSRMMAEQFAISRMTVLLAYERLIAEGYLETRPAAGTFVAQLPAPATGEATTDASSLALAHLPPTTRARTGEACQPAPDMPANRVGAPDPALFPAQRWRSLMRHAVERTGTRFQPEHPAGHPALREAIARWLSTSRGLPVIAEQVMLMRSRQQALQLVGLLASHPCEGRRALRRSTAACLDHQPQYDPRRIVVEDPAEVDAAAALAASGGVLLRIAVDADGMRTALLPDCSATLIHVTPEHQRPLGAVLAHDRRLALLLWAERAGALVLEEDIDGELRYGTMNVPSLMRLDRSERVILLGGFGVSLGPWLDVAWLMLPRWLVPYGLTIRRQIDGSRGGLEPAVLAEYLDSGGYARHLHRLTRTYASRRDALVNGLRHHIDEIAPLQGQQSGLHLAWFPSPQFGPAHAIAALARRHGLDAAPCGDDAVLLGFGLTDTAGIATGIERLAAALRQPSAEPRAVRPPARSGQL